MKTSELILALQQKLAEGRDWEVAVVTHDDTGGFGHVPVLQLEVVPTDEYQRGDFSECYVLELKA